MTFPTINTPRSIKNAYHYEANLHFFRGKTRRSAFTLYRKVALKLTLTKRITSFLWYYKSIEREVKFWRTHTARAQGEIATCLLG